MADPKSAALPLGYAPTPREKRLLTPLHERREYTTGKEALRSMRRGATLGGQFRRGMLESRDPALCLELGEHGVLDVLPRV